MPRVLITGATSGLGLELAKGFHAQGADLVLVGRKPLTQLSAQLPEFFNQHHYCQADLAERTAATQVRDFVAAHDIHTLDIVIHNAAVGYYGDVREQSTESIKTLLEVNLHAPLALTHALLEPLTAAHGRLVFISSVAADMPAPDYAVYSASKAALDGLARNLSVEFWGSLRVQVIHPGATRTAMHHKSGVPKHLDTRHFADPEHVAHEIIRAIYEDRFDVTIGRGNRLLRFLGKHFGGIIEIGMRWRKRRQARQQSNAAETTNAAETAEPLARAVTQIDHTLPQATSDKHEPTVDESTADESTVDESTVDVTPERPYSANGAATSDQDANTSATPPTGTDISPTPENPEDKQADKKQKDKQRDSSEGSPS